MFAVAAAKPKVLSVTVWANVFHYQVVVVDEGTVQMHVLELQVKPFAAI